MTSPHDSISEQVTAMQAGMATQLPAEAVAAFTNEQRELAGAGVPETAAAPGTPLPEVELLDPEERTTSVRAVADGRPAVVVFYRGAWCPYCNIALRTYETRLAPELERRGVALVAVSPQRPDGSLGMSDANGLSFAVLSDPGNHTAAALGILTRPSDAILAVQRSIGLDLTEHNADGTTGLPLPTVLVLDAAGVIRWIDVHPDYSTRTEPEAVLRAVDALAAGATAAGGA